jgi:hypothetical protein
MDISDVKIFMDVIVTFTVIFGILLSISKFLRKKIANYLLKQIDETSPDCYATDAIKLSKTNLVNIQEINDNISFLKTKIEEIPDTLGKITERLEDGDKHFSELKKAIIRLEILRFIDHDHTDIKQITGLYDQYKKLGGNSYIDIVYKNYINNYKNNK